MVVQFKIKETLEKVTLNRLFLIGNGFDLSLGLKTKYSDFLLWLLKREIVNAINSGIREAPFEKYKGRYDSISNEYYRLQVNGYSENKLFDVLLKQDGYRTTDVKVLAIDNLSDLFEFNKNYRIEINPPKTSRLMVELLNASKTNWVDIENTYFELLRIIVQTKDVNGKIKHKDSIDHINNELSNIVFYLKEYLSSLDINIDNEVTSKYIKHFNDELDVDDFLEYDNSKQEVSLGLNYFLNFNYTDSLTRLLNNNNKYNYLQNHIHGDLINSQIIFGFGDEMDSIYKQIEELNDNRYFEHIKSFHYFKTPNQRKLQTFLNSGFYQVCIYGHSCGLSDRVMLNEIFEHENCKSIKIYYYNDDDFTTKTMEISRHFKSNKEMRKKIVDKSIACLIPQINK
jgi:hypothetical protein